MSLPEESTLLRIFIGEADEVHGRPLYKAIVTRARELHMAGATVVRGPLGFGRSSMLHTEKILRLSQDLPVVIESVDADEIILTSRKQAKSARVKLEAHVIPGHAVSSIVEFVEREKFDLLVIGFMGHSALYNRLIGSTTDRLVELAPCKVLVVK